MVKSSKRQYCYP